MSLNKRSLSCEAGLSHLNTSRILLESQPSVSEIIHGLLIKEQGRISSVSSGFLLKTKQYLKKQANKLPDNPFPISSSPTATSLLQEKGNPKLPQNYPVQYFSPVLHSLKIEIPLESHSTYEIRICLEIKCRVTVKRVGNWMRISIKKVNILLVAYNGLIWNLMLTKGIRCGQSKSKIVRIQCVKATGDSQ